MYRKSITTLKFLRKHTSLSNLSAGVLVNVGGAAGYVVDGIVALQITSHQLRRSCGLSVALTSVAP